MNVASYCCANKLECPRCESTGILHLLLCSPRSDEVLDLLLTFGRMADALLSSFQLVVVVPAHMSKSSVLPLLADFLTDHL